MIPARGLVIAHRVPAAPVVKHGNPFTWLGDVDVKCGQPGCGWGAIGERSHVKKALDEHQRMCHGSDRVEGIFKLNYPNA